ncbi:hypothetical protein SLA2020_100150 [Shorea laevis]
MSTSFVKPKSKPSKKKNKSLGPIAKETKLSSQKPYDLPPNPKKQGNPTPMMLPSIQPASTAAPFVSSGQDKLHMQPPTPPIPHSMNPPQTLPPDTTTSPPSHIASSSMSCSMPPLAGQLITTAIVPSIATVPSTSSL